jgi:hypothetical protein
MVISFSNGEHGRSLSRDVPLAASCITTQRDWQLYSARDGSIQMRMSCSEHAQKVQTFGDADTAFWAQG